MCCFFGLPSIELVGCCAAKRTRLPAGCSHHLHSGNWDGVRGVHPGQHASARYHRQPGDQRAASYRTEGVQEPLGGEEGNWTSSTHSRFSGKGILIAQLKLFNMELFCIEQPSDVIGAMHFLCCTYWTHSLREQPAEATEEERGRALRLPICHTGHLPVTACVQTPPNHLLSIITHAKTIFLRCAHAVWCQSVLCLSKCSLSASSLAGFEGDTQSPDRSLKLSAIESYSGHSKSIFVLVRS